MPGVSIACVARIPACAGIIGHNYSLDCGRIRVGEGSTHHRRAMQARRLFHENLHVKYRVVKAVDTPLSWGCQAPRPETI